jgi:hypothetical protein
MVTENDILDIGMWVKWVDADHFDQIFGPRSGAHQWEKFSKLGFLSWFGYLDSYNAKRVIEAINMESKQNGRCPEFEILPPN